MEQENNFDSKILKVNISLGVAEMTKDMESADVLLKKADDALYRAKNEGRNRVVAL